MNRPTKNLSRYASRRRTWVCGLVLVFAVSCSSEHATGPATSPPGKPVESSSTSTPTANEPPTGTPPPAVSGPPERLLKY